jgi:hypothetical protein
MTKPKPRKPSKKFTFAAYMFAIEKAGTIREPILGLYAHDGTESWYCAWFSDFKVHAVDWALINNKDMTYNVFSTIGGDTPVRFTHFEVQDPITIDQLMSKDNKTQIGIALKKKDSFLVRFIISYNNDKDRHTFMVEYPGVPPSDLVGKVYWGVLREIGDTPLAVLQLFPSKS